MAKLKMTGFARLIIAMIFIVPLAYLGATFIDGGGGLNEIKEMVGMETSKVEAVEEIEMTEAPIPAEREDLTPAALAEPPMEKVGQDEEAMNELRDKLNEMYDENSALKEEIVKLREELARKEGGNE